MASQQPFESPSMRAHKRQLTWQILVPLLAVMALILAASVLVITKTGSADRTWADVSIIWLIAPLLVFALVFVLVLGFLIYGIARLLQIMPGYTSKAQGFFNLLSGRIRLVADGTAKPVVWFHQVGALLKSIIKL